MPSGVIFNHETVFLDGEVTPRSEWPTVRLAEGSKVEVLAAIQGGAEGWELGGRAWGSRLIAGTGGFRSLEQMEAALAAAGTEIVTVAGHINEAGDVFAEDYPMPPVREGDVVALLNAGGYLQAMSSTHCLRPMGTAVFLDR